MPNNKNYNRLFQKTPRKGGPRYRAYHGPSLHYGATFLTAETFGSPVLRLRLASASIRAPPTLLHPHACAPRSHTDLFETMSACALRDRLRCQPLDSQQWTARVPRQEPPNSGLGGTCSLNIRARSMSSLIPRGQLKVEMPHLVAPVAVFCKRCLKWRF